MIFFINLHTQNYHAKVAQLVEHDLAKVGVAGPNPVFRSRNAGLPSGVLTSPDFIRGIDALVVELVDTQDLKSCGFTAVRVQVPPGVHFKLKTRVNRGFFISGSQMGTQMHAHRPQVYGHDVFLNTNRFLFTVFSSSSSAFRKGSYQSAFFLDQASQASNSGVILFSAIACFSKSSRYSRRIFTFCHRRD